MDLAWTQSQHNQDTATQKIENKRTFKKKKKNNRHLISYWILFQPLKHCYGFYSIPAEMAGKFSNHPLVPPRPKFHFISACFDHSSLFRWISAGTDITSYLPYFWPFTSWMAHILIPLQQFSNTLTVAGMNPSHGRGGYCYCYCCCFFFSSFLRFVRLSFSILF